VFAYGSNMDLDDLRRWLDDKGYASTGLLSSQPGILSGFALVWNYHSKVRAGGAANIEERSGAQLPGLVLTVDAKTLAAIDRKEGHPHRYSRGSRRRSVVLRDNSRVDAWVYVVQPQFILDNIVPPAADYLRLIVAAARKHRLPLWHIALLEQTPIME